MKYRITDESFIPSESTAVRCTPHRVLIVDDNDSVRRVFKRVLHYALPECRTDLAANGTDAVRLFGLNHYSVILMDLRMPMMDGDQAFYEIEQLCIGRGWDIPRVIFCTGYIPSDHVLDRIQHHGERFALLHKPVENRVLIASIRERLAA